MPPVKRDLVNVSVLMPRKVVQGLDYIATERSQTRTQVIVDALTVYFGLREIERNPESANDLITELKEGTNAK